MFKGNFKTYITACQRAGIISNICGDLPEIGLEEVALNHQLIPPARAFIAKKGPCFDSHQCIPEALARDAKAILRTETEHPLPENICDIHVSNSFLAEAILAECKYGYPAHELSLLAITGTNGKTTSVFLLQTLIKQLIPSSQCGLLSTVYIDNGNERIEAEQTTPSPEMIQKTLRQMCEQHCTHAVMEQSSHGLHQYRTGTTLFDVAIFSNLTGDHLDYHGTTEAYYQCKERLFTECLRANGHGIINCDDSYGGRLYARCQKENIHTITFGHTPNADAYIHSESFSLHKTTFSLTLHGKTYRIRSPYIGAYNVMNLTGALLALCALGIPEDELFTRISTLQFPNVPGRMERFLLPCGGTAFVDYAHTDDALARAIQGLRTICKGRIITVFGCGGNRDKTKRPRMGKVATESSDFVIITSDNPRNESPIEIIHEIKTGIHAGYAGQIVIEPDRARAIEKALAMTQPNDVVLIAGKGHENYQDICGIKHPFDDREEVRKYITMNSKSR